MWKLKTNTDNIKPIFNLPALILCKLHKHETHFLISIPKIDMLVMKYLVVLSSDRWKCGVSYSHEVWVFIYFSHWQFSDSSPWSMGLSFRTSHLHPFYFSRHRNVVGCVRQWFTVKHNWLDLSKSMFFWDSVYRKNIESTCVVFSCCHWHPAVNKHLVHFQLFKILFLLFVLMWFSYFSKLTSDAKIV